MVKFLPPRSFPDLRVPTDSQGRPLLHDNDYEAYVKWLVDYLYETEIPLHARQQVYALSTDQVDPDSTCFQISDNAAMACFELEMVEEEMENGQTWEKYDAEQRRSWEEEEYKEMETYEEWSLTKSDWERIHDEWLEKQATPDRPDVIDLPYRALLARIFKRVPQREKRIEMANRFFQNYTETAAK